jgi:hypothetical protein
MKAWLPSALRRIRERARAGRVFVTRKAEREMRALRLTFDDATDILAALAPEDSAGRVRARLAGEWMYVFRPYAAGTHLYLKVLLRVRCVVVSMHEDEEVADESE